MQTVDIRHSTISSLSTRFCVDTKQAERVVRQACDIFEQFTNDLTLSDTATKNHAIDLLTIGCQLHELGLTIGFKNHPQHGAYILQNADLAGFDQTGVDGI